MRRFTTTTLLLLSAFTVGFLLTFAAVARDAHAGEIRCGNEVVDPGEECDDGNDESGDGCSSTCLIEGQSTDCAIACSLPEAKHVSAANEVLIGTSGDDILCGDDRPNVLRGEDGDDILCGFGADDTLLGHLGDDYLDGGDGNDVLRGEDGDDTLVGGTGNDALYGHLGNDILEGDTGNDTLRGGGGDDTLEGGSDADVLNGEGGVDTCNDGEAVTNCP